MILSNACMQGLHHRCPGRGAPGAARCDCACHPSSKDQVTVLRMAEDAVLREIPDTTVGPLTEALGFHPLMGGRKLAELRCSSLNEGRVYIEIAGSFVTVDKAKRIAAILREAE